MTRSLSRDLVLNLKSDLGAVMAEEAKSARDSAKVIEQAIAREEAAQKRLAQESEKAAREIEQATAKRHAAYTKAGFALAGFGAAVSAGLGVATKAAIEWESAWAGVTKTVDGSGPQMDRLEGNLRQLAKELPATHQEIAAVAEAAGALGIKRENIVSFTKTMIDLGESTDLTADQAANALARIANVMGTSQDDIDRLGSALVALGNDGASTEAEITEMAQRIAGAGHQIGLTEGDVLGFASALSSVGINAEAGGSAISTAFIKISSAVESGSDELVGFAGVAGMTATDFARLFRQDASEAITRFVEGLGRMQQSGGDVFGVLDNLGLSEIRLRDAMLRTAGAGDLLRDSIETGNNSWAENTALTEEANKRYETTAARMAIARNQMHDFAITVGEAVMPAVGGVTERMGAWLDVISQLPKPVTDTLAVLGSVAGAASLAGGAFFLAVPKISEFKAALGDMGPKGQAFGRGLSGVTSMLAGPWGIALGAAVVGLGIFIDQKAKAAEQVREFTRALEQDSGALGKNTRAYVVHRLEQEGALEAAEDLGIGLRDVTEAVLGQGPALDQMRSKLKGIADANTVFTETGTVMTAEGEAAGQLLIVLDRLNSTVDTGIAAHQREADAMREAGVSQETTAVAARKQEAAQSELNKELDDGASLAKRLKEELEHLTAGHIAADEAELRWLDTIHDTIKALGESTKAGEANARSLDINTEKGRENRQSILDVAQAATDHVTAMAEEGRSYEEVRQAGINHRKELINLVGQFGITGAEADRYVDRLYQIPPERNTMLTIQEQQALEDIALFERKVNESLRNISDRNLTITFGAGRLVRAAGGPIFGPGTGTSDSVPVMASHGEHMWTAREVDAVGGHGQMYALRSAALSGALPRLARGGPVDWMTDIILHTAGLPDRAAEAQRYIGQFDIGNIGAISAGVAQWANLVLQALAMMNQPASLLGVTLRRMNQESGGNPNAINLWDINAQRGDPSRGLMQTIGSTFRAYHFPGTSWDIYDPLANILASMRYALDRYGSLASAYGRPGGYDAGGMLGPPLNGTGRPERVLTPQQTASFDRLVEALTTQRGRAGSGGTVENHYHLHTSRPEATVRAEFERMQLMHSVS